MSVTTITVLGSGRVGAGLGCDSPPLGEETCGMNENIHGCDGDGAMETVMPEVQQNEEKGSITP